MILQVTTYPIVRSEDPSSFPVPAQVVVHRFADCEEVQEAPVSFVLEAFFFFKTKETTKTKGCLQKYTTHDVLCLLLVGKNKLSCSKLQNRAGWGVEFVMYIYLYKIHIRDTNNW